MLTYDEVADAVGGEDDVGDIFNAVDLNSDGVISYEEFKALMQVLMILY
jgi:Ca2+-binding EF-hand superfamily protein